MLKTTIEKMKKSDLLLALQWAAEEDWNPGKYDYKYYFKTDPEEFLKLCLDEKLIGSIAVVKYEKHAFIGLFIIKKEHRRKGYGAQLWEKGLSYQKLFEGQSVSH